HVGLDEPFAGLFTQGMVVHETYQKQSGEWVTPDEVDIVTVTANMSIGEIELAGKAITAASNGALGFIDTAESPESTLRVATLKSTGEPIEIGSIEKMSKSKKNTVDPDDIIRDYGADVARWFMLSDSPPERDVIWTEEGVRGASRFVQRLWRHVI